MRIRAMGLATGLLLMAAPAFAGDTKTYQVTGPVTAVTSDSITVQKGKESWQIAKDAATKTSGAVKPGDKVTIQYRMTAASIDLKAAPAKKP